MTGYAWWPDPEVAAATNVARFMAAEGIARFDELVDRSVREPEWFWAAVERRLGPFCTTPYSAVLDESDGAPWARWFVGGRLNVAEVCVDRHASEAPGRRALVWEGEDGEVRSWTYAELHAEADGLAVALRARGVEAGDAVGIFMPMIPETVAALLGIAKLGAVFLPLFSGYGAPAVAARLADAGAVALVTADGFLRRGAQVPMQDVALEAVGEVDTVRTVVVVGRLGRLDTSTAAHEGRGAADRSRQSDDRVIPWPEQPDQVTRNATGDAAPRVDSQPVDTEHPLFIAYTSGTTGRPKGSVHVHGGFLVKVAEEVSFQFDCRAGDVLWWFTDMGWIMGPWEVVGTLAAGATLALYEGTPDHPAPDRMWAFAERHGVTILGASPTLVRSLMAHGDDPVRSHDLSSLRILGSTGEPWNEGPWWWYFEVVGGGRCPVINISGGTEVGACFLSPHPLVPIKPLSLGGPSLGMALDVYDSKGRPVRGAVGELVCTRPWPGMTRGLYRDPERYLDTYWRRWPGVWTHGDWASVDEDGQWFLHGRSDDTIKVAGKRLGPAEVESVVVSHPLVVEAAAIGVPDPVKGEALWVYAVRAGAGASPDDRPPVDEGALRTEIADLVTASLGKAFRPSAVRFVAALPKTRNAKILRRVVKAVATGEDAGDVSALEDPGTLEGIASAR